MFGYTLHRPRRPSGVAAAVLGSLAVLTCCAGRSAEGPACLHAGCQASSIDGSTLLQVLRERLPRGADGLLDVPPSNVTLGVKPANSDKKLAGEIATARGPVGHTATHGAAFRIWNTSVVGRLEYELNFRQEREVQTVNKLTLAVISLLGCGVLGVDRCFMGQVCLGTLKGLTFGGFLVWFVIDYFVLLINCITLSPEIDMAGYRAHFRDGTVMPACLLAIVCSLFKLSCSFVTSSNKVKAALRKTGIISARPDTAELRAAFAYLDKAQRGYIDREQLGYAMERCGNKLSEQELDQLMRRFDMDGDGHVSITEFLQGMGAES